MDDDFASLYPELAAAEREIERQDALIRRGRRVIDELKTLGIDPDDRIALADFFELRGQDEPAYYAALDYLDSLKASTEPTPTPTPTNHTPPQQPTPTAQPEAASGSDVPLMEVAENWFRFNIHEKTKRPWDKTSQNKFIPHTRIFVEMVGNPPAGQLTKEMIRDRFGRRITRLPTRVHQRKAFKGKDIDEILKLADEQNIPRVQATTAQEYVKTACRFLNWAAKQDYVQPNLDSVLEDLTNFAESEDKRRKYFTDDELKALFESPEYQEGLLFKKPHLHWVPLIALYTGCRLGEASQLFVRDIRRDQNGIWYFDFTDEGESQKIKSKSSKRRVPIHPDLKRLGLLRYHEQMKARGEKQLFPALSPDSVGHWGRAVSRWFNGYTTNNGRRIEGFKEIRGVATNDERKITLHSFRHYVVNRSKQQSVEGSKPRFDYSVWCEITGHSEGAQTVRQQSYEDSYPLKVKDREIKKYRLDFLDVDSIKRWY